MFQIDEDMTIYVTRGDVAFFQVSASNNGVPYKFQVGDVVRMKVMQKKNCTNVAFQKDFPVLKETDKVEILLTEEETKIGDVISKPVDYWYEVELNPYTNPQTIIGYDDEGAKIFKVFPEGRDLGTTPISEEDIPVVDSELSLVSDRPIQNQAVARAIVGLDNDVKKELELHNESLEKAEKRTNEAIGKVNKDMANLDANISRKIRETNNALAVERARINNLTANTGEQTAGNEELIDIRVGFDGKTYNSAGEAVREQVKNVSDVINKGLNIELIDIISRLNVKTGYYSKLGNFTSYNSSWNTGLFYVEPSERYLICGRADVDCPLIATFDSDKNFISAYESVANSYEDYEFKVPNGVSFIVVNSIYVNILSIKKVVDNVGSYLENEVKNLKTALSCKDKYTEIDLEFTEVDGYYANTMRYDILNGISRCEKFVNYGEVYLLTSFANFSMCRFIVVDENNNPLLYDEYADYSLHSTVIHIPYGATKIIIQSETHRTNNVKFCIKENALVVKKWEGKTFVFDGDSICEGRADNGGGYAKIIGDYTGANIVNKGVSGGLLRTLTDITTTSRHSVVDTLSTLPTDADLYCFEGGINDFWQNAELGTYNDSDYTGELDTTTVCGALEYIFRYALNNFVGKAICFIIVHKCQTTSYVQNAKGNTFKDYHNAFVGICNKYSIPYYDAFLHSGLNGWNPIQSENYMANRNDGTHPNELGYKKYYVPQLLKLFESILGID